ncbi:MAG: hypothetical protein ABII75_04020 [Candidatus Omnitrophota bacterium]
MRGRFSLIGLSILLVMCLFGVFVSAVVCFAEDAATIEDALANAKINGETGSYFEFTDADAVDSDFGWSTGYLTLKYETQSWKRLKLGTRFFAHGQLYSDHDNTTTDPFDADIETPYTLPEFYLNYSVTEGTNAAIGRWDHRKISHIDDAQSEGAYIAINEIADLELIAGVMRRFAEIDYDDGEDFGCTNKTQDLDSKTTYGANSESYLFFIESRYKLSEMLTLNPYLMSQDGYASVYGLDTKFKREWEGIGVAYGAEVYYYHVSADIPASSDSDNFAVFPFVSTGPLEFTLGYASFDGGDSLNKPIWLCDYFTLVDQQKEYGNAGSDKYFAKVKLAFDRFWTHFAYGDNNYNFVSGRGDRSQEYELQFGYNVTENLALNLRLFDVQYRDVADKDYQKVESLVRFKF